MDDAALHAQELTDDALTARMRVYQRKRGHRYSLDDVVTAWVAIRACPQASPCLDLGCGLGSVLLMVADRLPQARVVGIEAQEVSFALAQRNVARNGVAERVHVLHGDLRDPALLAQLREHPSCERGFQLVTGTPPYKPVGTATASPDSQRAHARIELRGGVEAYLLAASHMLAQGGVCVVCTEAGAEARVQAGARAAGLAPRERLDVIPMRGRKGRLFSVHTLGRQQDETPGPVLVHEPFYARDEHGVRTEQERALRGFFGFHAAVDDASPPTRPRRPAFRVR